MEEALAAACELVRAIPHQHPSGLARHARRVRVGLSPLRGVPVQAAWWRVPAFAECVRGIAREWRPDVVQFEYHLMGQYLSALEACGAPRILVHHDPGANMAPQSRGLNLQRLLGPVDRHAARRYERAITRLVQTVVVFTDEDRSLLQPRVAPTPVVTIPLGITIAPPSDVLQEEPATLLFVGSFGHAPNFDAAVRLADAILPRVRARRPSARLVLVGAQAPPDLHRRTTAHVELAASVPDVRPFLTRATVVVLPLRLGGGMRVKALEALAAGKAVVASSSAVAGLAVRDGIEYCHAETDEEFADRVVELLADRERRLMLARNARAWAHRSPSWAAVAAMYGQLYERLLAA
jgi:glycosyltransferase involved in cell wall biosynthesis